jgi:hypothetical protein
MVVVAAAACVDSPTSPPASNAARLTTDALHAHGDAGRKVVMDDACEPTSFNQVLGDGACVGDGKVTFDEFIAELAATQDAKKWRFQPLKFSSTEGATLDVQNHGGEVHTFTPVAAFGGGFVTDLNGISGNPVPAPECLNFGSIVFIPAGGSEEVTVGAASVQLFQCCIHPWMRSTVKLK